MRLRPTILLVTVLTLLIACGTDEPVADDGGTSQDEPTTTAASPAPEPEPVDTTTASTEPEAEPEPEPEPDAADETIPSEADFCDALFLTLEAWAKFDILDPPDLTMAYETLGDLSPPELVDEFEVLAEGNDILVATRDSSQLPPGYDEAGATVAAYAVDECGINLEDLADS